MFMSESVEADEGFGRPVESIMRCEDFKSHFARKLSNRYTSRPPLLLKQDTTLKLPPQTCLPLNAPERIENSTLSKSVIEQNGDAVKATEKSARECDENLRSTEVSALNMEVETLRWQLAQTEANRQMHIALLKQIVSFLSRVKEHIECQKPDMGSRKEPSLTRGTPRSFNVADLPRSRSVLHVNKHSEYSLSLTKKIATKKISKSISNVNGYRECSGVWSPSKLPLASEAESDLKITEEMSRLITLATAVLGTQIPDLCTCSDAADTISVATPDSHEHSTKLESISSLNSIDENTNFILDTTGESKETLSDHFLHAKDKTVQDCIMLSSPLICGLENDFANVKIEKENLMKTELSVKAQRLVETRNEYNVANFIEDESGFSSMNSFQEIGIPIISIIPPSPSKEVGYMDEITDILSDSTKWKNDAMDLDKQAVKVFWV